MKLSGVGDTQEVKPTPLLTHDLTLMSLIHTSSRPPSGAHQSQKLPLDLRSSMGVPPIGHEVKGESCDIPAAHLHHKGSICLWVFQRTRTGSVHISLTRETRCRSRKHPQAVHSAMEKTVMEDKSNSSICGTQH